MSILAPSRSITIGGGTGAKGGKRGNSDGKRDILRLGFGTMRLCGKGAWGWPADRDRALKVLRRARDGGIQFFDTADSYGPDVSEHLLRETLHPYDNHIIIASKGGMVRTGPRNWIPACTPQHLASACESSLRRLRIDSLFLYQLHAVDDDVALEDSLGELARLQSAGKLRHIGICSVNLDQLDRARAVCEIASVQNHYNLRHREHEDVLALCEEESIPFIAYRPLAAGKLAREGRLSTTLLDAARKHRATTAQIALAWLLHRSPVILPIPGTHSVAHLEQNLAALDLQLDPDEVVALSAASDLRVGF